MSLKKPIYSASLKKIVNNRLLPLIHVDTLFNNSPKAHRLKTENHELQIAKNDVINQEVQKIMDQMIKEGTADFQSKRIKKNGPFSGYRIATDMGEKKMKRKGSESKEKLSNFPKIRKRQGSEIIQLKKKFATEPTETP